MPNVLFRLKDETASESVVMLDFAYNNRRLRASSELVTSPDKFNKIWSAKRKQLNSKYLHWPEYQQLERAKSLVEDAYKQSRALGNIPSPDILKEILRSHLNQEQQSPAEVESDFFQRFRQYIIFKETTQKAASVVVYKQVLNDLEDFAKSKRKNLSFDSINLEFYDQYMDYLLNRPNTNANCKTEKGLLNDSIAKRITNLKMFMRWARERGYHQTSDFEQFKAKKAPKHDIVVLSESELLALEELDLSNNRRLEKVRDLFLFGTYTGQRWSDVAGFHASQIQGLNADKPVWVFTAHKTQKLTRVPLVGFTSKALAILNKYENCLPIISGVNFNSYIKEVAQLAGINSSVTLKRYSGKRLIEIKKPKYEFISSHCARRSFVTLLLEKGVPPTTIMKITGHTDLKTLMKYESTSDEAVMNALERIK
jgi:site-specific recombinase XerD